MFSQYFGNYLLNKGLINPGQLTDALDSQHSVHLKLGVLAINAGFMTASQVTEVHRAQTRADLKFGELAVKLGYLSNGQLEKLLSTQKKGHLLLGQALVDKGNLSLEQLQEALEEYRKEYGLSDKQLNAMQEGEVEEIVKTFVNFEDSPQKQIYTDYVSLMIRNVIRFIDRAPRLETGLVTGEYNAPWLVSQEIYGPVNLFTGIAAGEQVLLEIAGKYAGENFNEPNELACAAAAEFLNLINGIFLVNMSNIGIELEMKPQAVSCGKNLTGLQTGYIVPVNISIGKFDLIISGANPIFSP